MFCNTHKENFPVTSEEEKCIGSEVVDLSFSIAKSKTNTILYLNSSVE